MAVSITRKVSAVWAVAALMVLLSVAVTRADYMPGAGIAGSPHDFSGIAAGDTTTGACTFCHTPHRASGTFLAWNHTLPNTGYRYDQQPSRRRALPGSSNSQNL